jgi:uncharacterized membrane protein
MGNKVINITILLLLVLFISFRLSITCSEMDRGSQEHISEEIETLPLTFSGVLPCADCPAIDYHLVIEEDGFTELSWYRDRSPDPFKVTGEWVLRNDTLRIYDGETDQLLKTFLFGDQSLTLLDHSEQRVTGDLADMHRLEKSQEESSIRRRHLELKEDGIDFLASGNEPFWNVQIDFDGNRVLRYRTPESDIEFPLPEKSEENDVIRWYTENRYGSVTLTVQEKYCRDTMSGFLFTHTVTIMKNGGSEMHGCGRYL